MYAAVHRILVLATVICLATCSRDDCGPPPEVPRARITDPLEVYTEGSSVTYRCDNGFVTKNTGRRSQCTKDPDTDELIWSDPELTCIPRSCGDPGLVANAHRNGLAFTFPNHVEYVCKEGYRLSGASRRYCEPRGVWSGQLPSCIVVTCRRPTDPENGKALYFSLEYDSELTYKCGEGYQLSSTDARVCGPDGEWTGDEPSCTEVHCELPEEPKYGTMTLLGDNIQAGSVVLFECNPGRKIVGSGTSKCMITGEWTFPTPKCVEPCRVPAIANGELGRNKEEYIRLRWRTVFRKISEGTIMDENEQAILKCDDGYMHGSQPLRELTIACLNGELSPEPECISTFCLGKPPPARNGKEVVQYRHHGYAIWYTCNPGFKKAKDGNVTCIYGTWRGHPPVCEDTRCNVESLNYPGLIIHEGFVSSGGSLEPTCHSGYEVTEKEPDKKIYCNEGKWEGNLPPCTRASCKREDLLGFSGLILSDGISFKEGEWIRPICSAGYELSNKDDPRIYCNEGNWEGTLPPCSPAQCLNRPPVPDHGKIKGRRGFQHGSVVEYECFEGYIMVEGSSRVTCSFGHWNGSPPTCKYSACYLRNLPQKEGVDLTRDRPVHSSNRADIKCVKGYNLRNLDVVCRNGEWQMENTLSPCQENDCQVKNVPNGQMFEEKITDKGYFRGTETTYEPVTVGSSESNGAVLYVICTDRYKFQGEENEDIVEVTCKAGEWIPFPKCVLNACQVKRIPNGQMLEEKTTPVRNFVGMQTGTKTSYEPVTLGSFVNSGAVLYVKCRDRYKFQGEENKDMVEVTCRATEWIPFPECLLAKRNPEIELPTPSTEAVIVPTSVHTSLEEVTELHNDTLKNVEDNEEKGPVVDEIVSSENETVDNGEAELTTVTTVNPPCSCKYIVKDNNLIAHVGNKVLQFNDDVYKGSVVGFYCKEPGFHHLRGRTSVTCPEDCSWHSTLFPSCAMPNKDDVIIRILAEPANNIHVGPGGNITVIPGTKLLFTCSIPYKYGAELNWFRADGSRTGIQQPKINLRTQVLSTLYVLWDVSYRDSGTYTCINHERLTRTVSIEVKVVQCPEINATQVDISYEQNRTFGSRATFHCFTPYKRNGPSYVTCEASGLWSEPPSSCYLPTCTIVSVRDVIPKGVVPVIDDSALQSVTFGYRLQLICDPVGSTSMVLKGDTTAICGNDEKWELGSEIRCVEGCPSLQKKNGSALLISPERDFYGLGDLILFSCPEGKDLTKDVEQILCLSTGWTPNTIPDCK